MTTTSGTTTEEYDGKLHLFEIRSRSDFHLREKAGTIWDKCNKQPCPNQLVYPRNFTNDQWETPTRVNGWLIQPPTCAGVHHVHNTTLKQDQHCQDNTWVNCVEVFCPSRSFRRHTGANLTTPYQVISKKQIPDNISFEPYIPEPLRARTTSQQPSRTSS